MFVLGGGEGEGKRGETFQWRSLKERSKAFHNGKKVLPQNLPIKTLN